MTRPQHTHGGFLRYMQMSRNQVFVLVEGIKRDAAFYGYVCRDVLGQKGISYEACPAAMLQGPSGGKQTLLAYFEYLRTKGCLISTMAGKTTAAIFYLDKDIDDLLKCCQQSPHIVYTEHYEVENHIFEEGDLVRGAAMAASLDPSLLQGALSDAKDWCRHAALLWKEWVVLCILAQETGIRSVCNYRVTSRVNMPACAPFDTEHYEKLLGELEARSGLAPAEFMNRHTSVAERVDLLYASANHGKAFKGRWYAVLLAEDIERIASQHPFEKKGIKARLTACILVTLDFNEAWAAYLKQPLEALTAKL